MSRCRYEFKFLVNAETKKKILDKLKPGLIPDPHAVQGSYRITSLYFDTLDHAAFWDKLDGQAIRKKVRLRYYGEQPERPFLEMKGRYYQQVLKRRFPLDPELGKACLDLDLDLRDIPFQAKNPGEEEAFYEIQKLATTKFLRGAVVIAYLREAWVGRIDPGLRVTFDHFCQAHAPGSHLASATHAGLPFLDEKQIVFELKFNRRVPLWVRDELANCLVRPTRISKYAAGLSRRLEQMRCPVC